MSLDTAIFLIAILDLGIVLAVAAIMLVPSRLDRREDEASTQFCWHWKPK